MEVEDNLSVGMLEISNELSDKDDAILEEGLYEHIAANNQPPYQEDPLAIVIRDEDDTPIAGLKGTSFWDWMFVDLLWVAKEHRGQGAGAELLAAAEEEAIRRDCHSIYLWTHDFQAKDYYQKFGYEEFAALPDFPRGSARIGFMKRIAT